MKACIFWFDQKKYPYTLVAVIERALTHIAFAKRWGRQMRFVSGPRQSGKTTLARARLHATHCDRLYYLWDLRSVRQRYRTDELFFTADFPPNLAQPWVCMDEIHKMPQWKSILKGVFDALNDRCRLIVTGSARLGLVRRAGDSLAGRYFGFHLLPLTLAEVSGRDQAEAGPGRRNRTRGLRRPFRGERDEWPMTDLLQGG
jgi:predicted AAA+ superfamily ATPase